MNYTENPLEDLHHAMAHAEYAGFSDIHYEDRDWEHYRNTNEHRGIPKTRRPAQYDFSVYAMFPQTWGSTALGHGGMGASAITTAYTIVLECHATQEFLVYFGGRWCYTINSRSDNIELFLEDCKNHSLVSKSKSNKYRQGETE